MALYAYNLTTAAVTLAAGNPARTIPASAGVGTKSAPVNVTSELKGLSSYASLQAQVAAGTISFAWTNYPDYVVTGLTVAAPSSISRAATFTNPIAAELISIVADLSVANGAQTIAAQPDYPRKLQLRITDANSSITAGIITLVGTGPSGESLTEAITLTGGTATKISTWAYAHLTSATVSALAGQAAADHISMGVGAALGLPGAISTGGTFAVYKANLANADQAVGTVDAAAGTISPTTAADGTKTYQFWYTYMVNNV